MPLTREREGGRFWLPGEFGPEKMIDGSQNIVTPGFFNALGLPLLAGRRFAPTDRLGAPAVTIVNETLARQMWPGQDAIGKQILVGRSRWSLDVVGVIKDAKYRTIGETPSPFFYVPAALRYEPVQWIVLRPKSGSVIADVRAVVRGLDPNLPVMRAGAFADLTAFTLFPSDWSPGWRRSSPWLACSWPRSGSTASRRITRASAPARSASALPWARRARRPSAWCCGRPGAWRLAGIAIGLTAAALVTHLLEGMLYGVQPLDPLSFGGGATVLGILAVVAGLIPARRAASVNPVDALRAQ